MINKKLYTLAFGQILMLMFLIACGGPTPPADATVNGVSKVDRENGNAELSVSALEADGSVRLSGELSNPTADVNQPGFTVEPGVCGGSGEITSLGPVTAALTFDATPSLTSNCRGNGCPTIPNDPFDENGDTERRQGGLDFIERMQSDAQIAVSYFNEDTGFVRVQDFINDKDVLNQAVQTATSEEAIGGGTNLWNASIEAIDLLSTTNDENRIAIIFTDGGDTTRADPRRVEVAASQAGVRVFYIGLGETTNKEAMQNIASATDPEGLFALSENPLDLIEAFEGVANSSQASGCIDLGFSPIPPSGQTMTGSLSFTIDGGQFTSDYKVTF